MKYNKIVISILSALSISISISIHAQNAKSNFELELDEFRYSLYKDMEEFPSYYIVNNFDSVYVNSPLFEKINNFLEKNECEIIIYKKNILAKYKGDYLVNQ